MNRDQTASEDRPRWLGVANSQVLRQEAVRRVLEAAEEAIHERGRFNIVLAGGSIARWVYERLCQARSPWSQWQVYFSDECCLAPDDSARNSCMASEAWLNHVAIPPEQIHTIPAERGAFAAAVAYTHTLRNVGLFDLVLLNLGDDGHTAALFPAPAVIAARNAPDVIAVFDAPTVPQRRVSLSAARLSRTRAGLFLVAGERKRKAVSLWLDDAVLPARAIKPAAGIDILIESALLASPDRAGFSNWRPSRSADLQR